MRQMLFRLIPCIVCMALLPSGASATVSCGLHAGVTVNLVGGTERENEFEFVAPDGNLIYASATNGLGRDAMGGDGRDNRIICEDISSSGSAIAMRLGWENDLLYLFGLKQGSGRFSALKLFVDLRRDGRMHAEVNVQDLQINQIGARFGRKGDVRVRWCFNQVTGDWSNSAGPPGVGGGYWRSGIYQPCDSVQSSRSLAIYPNRAPTPVPGATTPVVVTPQVPADLKAICTSASGTGSDNFRGWGKDCQAAQTEVRNFATQIKCGRLGSNWSLDRFEEVDNATCRW